MDSGYKNSTWSPKYASPVLTFLAACVHAGSLFPSQGWDPCPPTLEVRTLNHWPSEVPSADIFFMTVGQYQNRKLTLG